MTCSLKPPPKLWSNVAYDIRVETGAEAVIAGGAVRDHVLGVPPEDLDVWLPLNPFTKAYCDERSTPCPAPAKYLAAGGSGTKLVYEAGVEPKINYILLSKELSVYELLATFDFGAVRAAFIPGILAGGTCDGGAWYFTSDFETDLANHTFTLKRSETPEQRDHSLARYLRFIERPHFKGWKLVEPNRYAVADELFGGLFGGLRT